MHDLEQKHLSYLLKATPDSLSHIDTNYYNPIYKDSSEG